MNEPSPDGPTHTPLQKPSMCGIDTFQLKGRFEITFGEVYPIFSPSQSRLGSQWQKLTEALNRRAVPSEWFSSTASRPQSPGSHLGSPGPLVRIAGPAQG